MHTHSLLGECACSDSEGWNDLDNQEPEGLRVQFGDKTLAKHVAFMSGNLKTITGKNSCCFNQPSCLPKFS